MPKPELPWVYPANSRESHSGTGHGSGDFEYGAITEDGNGTGHGEGFMGGPVTYWKFSRRKFRLRAMEPNYDGRDILNRSFNK